MKIKANVDRTPPQLLGDVQKDFQNMSDYLAYLRDQINRLINILNKEREA